MVTVALLEFVSTTFFDAPPSTVTLPKFRLSGLAVNWPLTVLLPLGETTGDTVAALLAPPHPMPEDTTSMTTHRKKELHPALFIIAPLLVWDRGKVAEQDRPGNLLMGYGLTVLADTSSENWSKGGADRGNSAYSHCGAFTLILR
jgi:hypothetical protein